MLANRCNAFVLLSALCLALATASCIFDINVTEGGDGGSGGTGSSDGGSGGGITGSGGAGGDSTAGTGGSGGGGGAAASSGGVTASSGGGGGASGSSASSDSGGAAGSTCDDNGAGDSTDVTLTPEGGNYAIRNESCELVATLSVPAGALLEGTAAALRLGAAPELPDTLEVVSEALVIDLEDGGRLQLGIATWLRLAELPPDADAFWILAATEHGIHRVEALRFHADVGTPTVEFDLAEEGTYFVVRTAPQDDCLESVIDGTTVRDAAGLAAIAGVTRVHGDLLVLLESDHGVSSLDPLRCLAQVDGELQLSDASSGGPLVDLNSLSQLTLVGDRLYVDIPSLESAAFPALVGADGDVEFLSGGDLALDALSHVGGTFLLDGNVLTAFLPMLRVVRSHLFVYATSLQTLDAPLVEVGGSLHMVNNSDLAHIGALESLQRVGAGIQLLDNDALAEANLPVLTEVGTSFQLVDNDALAEANLPVLTEVGKTVELSGNNALTQFVPPKLKEVESIYIQNNAALETFAARAVEALPGMLMFAYNGGPGTDLSFDMAQLTEAGGVAIYSDTRMLSFTGLPNLEVTHGQFFLFWEGQLTSASFSALRQTGSELWIHAPLLQDLELPELSSVVDLLVSPTAIEALVFPKLETVAGHVVISLNPSLKICAANLVNKVTGGLFFGYNGTDGESTTFSMSQLAEIGSSFQIVENPGLTSLDGFPALEEIGGDFDVERNANLPNCEAVELLEQVQAQNEIPWDIIIRENLGVDCGVF